MRFSFLSISLPGLLLFGFLAGNFMPLQVNATEERKAEQKTPEQAELDRPRLVIKNGSIFMVLDPNGTMSAGLSAPYGLYLNDTRYLSGLTISACGEQLKALSSETKDGYKATFNYQTKSKIAIEREIVIAPSNSDGASLVAERLTLKNPTAQAEDIDLKIDFNFDFKDMFEVRGQTRKAHGTTRAELTSNQVKSIYTGLDNKVLTSAIQFSDAIALSNNQALYKIKLGAGASKTIEFAVLPEPSSQSKIDFTLQQRLADKAFDSWTRSNVAITCDKPELNQVFSQAVRDLYLLKIDTPHGPAFAAGLPWYSVAFGRDQVITALQIIDFAPDSARQIIELLANYQGKKEDKFTEETPGKIMHELRTGEMARTREIPFIPYYGTIDATPLWLVLVNRYVESSGDLELARRLWPNIEAALSYLKANTTDDFLFYGKVTSKVDGKEPALTNQAWKDSGDSVMHKDGKLATPPIAICEVQGYLYDAWQSGANLAEKLGKVEEANSLRERAKRLKEHFKKTFWLADQNYVALAIDGTPEPCSVIASNPGHLLSSGIIDKEEARAIAERLLKNDMFSGWGIRTLSSKEKAYDPASYHNGSIWPHDNALIAAGLRQHQLHKEAATVIAPLLEVAMQSKDKRLPELFCGYPREQEKTPRPYAVSCVPQLWCVGSVFSMIESLTGLTSQGQVEKPQLPQGVNWIKFEIPDAAKNIVKAIEIKRQGKSDQFTAQVTVRQR